MALRTYMQLLVQIGVLLFATAAAAQSNDYGRPDNAETTPSATVIEVPAAERHAQSPSPQRPRAQPQAQRNTPAPQTPPRGMTKGHVLAGYGQPQTRHAPVGQPPITRWDYPGYRLYFEYDHVLHAVVSGAPEPVAHTGQLQQAKR